MALDRGLPGSAVNVLFVLALLVPLQEREPGSLQWLWPLILSYLPLGMVAGAGRQLLAHLLTGAWLAAIGFMLLPCAVLSSSLCVSSLLVGGPALLARGCAAQGVGAVLGVCLFGLAWTPASSLSTVLACVPLLVLHPLAVAVRARQMLHSLQNHSRALEDLSRRDSMTGLFNRGYLETCLQREFARCRRSGQCAVLLLIDIDHFKRVNDLFGHSAGDAVIRGLAALLQEKLRAEDIAGRYGGEEFCLLLVNASLRSAIVVAERLCQELETRPLLPGRNITVSFGIAEWNELWEDWSQWFDAADRALYAAKASGRNRWSIAAPGGRSYLDADPNPNPQSQST